MSPDRASAARPVALGLAAVVLGLVAHSNAGGAVAPSGLVAVIAALVVMATALVGMRPPGAIRTPAALVCGQLTLHLGLSAPAATTHAPHTVHEPAPHGPAMLVAHLVVAIVVAGGIVHADRALMRAADMCIRRAAAVWWTRVASHVGDTTPAEDVLPGSFRTVPSGPRLAAVGRPSRRGPPSGP